MGETKLLGEAEAIQKRVLIPVFENGAITGSKPLTLSLLSQSHLPQAGATGCCWKRHRVKVRDVSSVARHLGLVAR